MKKVLVSVVCLVALSFAAIPAGAQTRARCSSGSSRRYEDRRTTSYDSRVYQDSGYRNEVYNDPRYRNQDYRYGSDRSVWERSRDKITTAAGAGAGAVVGGLIGGKKGAIIGAIAGGGGAALYTYKIRDKYRRY